MGSASHESGRHFSAASGCKPIAQLQPVNPSACQVDPSSDPSSLPQTPESETFSRFTVVVRSARLKRWNGSVRRTPHRGLLNGKRGGLKAHRPEIQRWEWTDGDRRETGAGTAVGHLAHSWISYHGHLQRPEELQTAHKMHHEDFGG